MFEWGIGLELKVKDQRGDEEERSNFRVNQIRVLPEPPEPRLASEVALEDRSGVDVGFPADLVTELGFDQPVQLVKSLRHHIVIVVTTRVTGDGTGRRFSAVVEPDDDGARGRRKGCPGVAPFSRAAVEIFHLPREAPAEPFLEAV